MPYPKKPIADNKIAVEPTSITKLGQTHFRSFIDFIRSQGVIGLAVGLVLGGAVTTLVKSMIDNIVMPPIGFLLGSGQGLKGLSWTIGQTIGGNAAVLNYGLFLNDLINFVVIALVVYLMVRLLKVEKIEKK